MAKTKVGGEQINRGWLATGGIGLVVTGLVAGNILFGGKNPAGLYTSKDLADGTREQSGSLLIQSGSNTLYANSITRRLGIRTLTPKTEIDVVGAISGSTFYVSRAMSGAGLSDCDTAGTSKLLWD